MFKIIKYIVSSARKKDEQHRALMNMILLFRKPDNLFVESSIDEVNYVFKEIIKLQKENKDLKAELDLVYDDLTAVVEKCCYTQYREGEQPRIQDDQMKIILDHIEKLHKDISTLLKEKSDDIKIKP